MIIKQALNRYAASAARTFDADRTQTLGASEVGQCERRVFYLKSEADPQQGIARDAGHVDGWGARTRGTTYENAFWVPALKQQFGERLKFAGEDQQTFASGFLSATPDGMLIDLTEEEQHSLGIVGGTCVMLECKTIDPRATLEEAKHDNVYQTQIQMGLVRELTPYKPTHALISYTDASWWDTISEYVIPFDPKVFAAGEKRALRIMTAGNAADLKPEGWIAGGRECRYCPFTKACGIERRNIPFSDEETQATLANIDPQFIAEITDLAHEVRAAEHERDVFDNAVRDAQERIKERLREKKVRKIPGVVSWTNVKGRQGYDIRALVEACEAAGIDTTPFTTEGTPGDRLTISLKQAEAERRKTA